MPLFFCTANYPQRMSLGIWPTSIRGSLPSLLSLRRQRRVNMVFRPVRDRVGYFALLPRYEQHVSDTPRVKCIPSLLLFAYLFHVSLPKRSVHMTQALQTVIFVLTESQEFSHTRMVLSRECGSYFSIVLSISVSRMSSLQILHMKYANWFTTSSSQSSMVMISTSSTQYPRTYDFLD